MIWEIMPSFDSSSAAAESSLGMVDLLPVKGHQRLSVWSCSRVPAAPALLERLMAAM
jgi:hypothetical protein